MIDIAFKNLWARKTRSLLTVLGVAVCVMLYLFMAGTTAWVESSLEKEMAKYAGQIYVKSPSVSGWTGVEFPPASSVIDSETARRFGADFSAVVPEMLALIGFAVVFGIIAVWRFRTSAAS